MSRRCKEVNFVLESADYSNLVHTSRRMSLEMIFLCLVRMYVHNMDSNVLWTMTLRRWRRASKASPRHHQHRHGTRLGSTDGTPCSDRTSARLNHTVTTSCIMLCTCISEQMWTAPTTSDGFVVVLDNCVVQVDNILCITESYHPPSISMNRTNTHYRCDSAIVL